MARLVVAEIDADREIGREADEPDILFVVGGAGLAGDRLADLAHHGRGAALHDAFHHRGDLVGGHRIDHLLAPVDQRRLGLVLPLVGRAAAAFALVVLVDGAAVAVLDAVDQRRHDALAAVVEHRIGGRPCAARSSRRRRARTTDRAAGCRRRRSAWRIRRSAACRRPARAAPSWCCATARCR